MCRIRMLRSFLSSLLVAVYHFRSSSSNMILACYTVPNYWLKMLNECEINKTLFWLEMKKRTACFFFAFPSGSMSLATHNSFFLVRLTFFGSTIVCQVGIGSICA